MASKTFDIHAVLPPTRGPWGSAVLATVLAGAFACASGETIDGDEANADDTVGDTVGGTEVGTESTEDGTADTETTAGDEATTSTEDSGTTDEGECTSLGCACDGSEESCDEGLTCIDGTCQTQGCNNNGVVEDGEQCDDGNDFEGDGCNNDCTWTQVLDVGAGRSHTCALIEGGRVRCWGLNNNGQLGYKNTENFGDNEPPSDPADVPLGEDAVAISVGGSHACATLDNGTVRCWGQGDSGQLGLGNTNNVGDDEFPFDVITVNNLDDGVLGMAAGGSHSCALVGAGAVRCWGLNASGQLGYGNTTNLTVVLNVDLTLGALATLLVAGEDHNCALLDDGKVRCWGRNNRGQLGYGNTDNIGDDESPGSVVPVPITPQGIPDGTAITDIALGHSHSCVLYETGDLLCWGDNFYGQLGQGDTETIGDTETLATLFPVDVGDDVDDIALGKQHTCAMMSGEIKCWGRNLYGQLGRGNIQHVGDDEVPADISPIVLGGTATALTAGDYHTCAIVDGHEVVCWGFNDYGQLGYGDTELRGDDELPAESGGIPLL